MTQIPYSGTNVKWNNEGDSFHLTLPWISLEVEVNPEEKPWIEEAIYNLGSNYQHPLVQRFLEQLSSYNVCYTAPRSLNKSSLQGIDTLHGINDPLPIETPKSFVKSLSHLIYEEIEEALPEKWQWSLDDILNESKIPNASAYDPITVVTYLIGKRLENESQSDDLRKTLPHELDTLRQKNEEEFFKVMGVLLTQTYYVTSHFIEYMFSSLEVFSEAKAVLEMFMQDEKGHDRLMIHALEELGYSDSLCNLKPFTSTCLSMELLKWSSAHSPLALTLMIGYFEGTVYEESDSLADVLARSSKPQAAKGYAVHHQINKGEHHSAIIINLAKYLKPQSKTSVAYATRILELASILGEVGDNQIINIIKEEKRSEYKNY